MNRPLQWGVLGTSTIAKNAIIPAIQQSERGEVLAIASRSKEKAEALAEEMDIVRSYGSYEELIADPDIQAVYIPLPNHLHREWTIKAAEAGKHVLCEKPAALNAKESIEMIEACERHGVLFSEAIMYRYHPKHRRVQDIIESGEIGTVRAIHGNFTCNTADDKDNVRFKKIWAEAPFLILACTPFRLPGCIWDKSRRPLRFMPYFQRSMMAST